jgi:hypothetical protein
MLQRTHCDHHASQLDIDRVGAKLGVRQDAVEALHDIQIAELRNDQRSLAAAQLRGNGTLRTEQRFALLGVATDSTTSRASLSRFSGTGSGTMSQSFVPRITPHDPSAKPPMTTNRISACTRRTSS